MPRKYHRPPDTTKRRKIRKTSIPQSGEQPDDFVDAPESENGALDAPVAAVSIANPAPEAEDSPKLKGTLRAAAASGSDRHVGRDYSYVVGDLLRVSVIAAFLIISLIITAVLR